MSLISLIARSSSVGTKCGPPQCRSEMWAILNAPFSTPDMRGSVRTRTSPSRRHGPPGHVPFRRGRQVPAGRWTRKTPAKTRSAHCPFRPCPGSDPCHGTGRRVAGGRGPACPALELEAVDRAELRAQVAEQRLRVEAAADHALEELAGHVLAAVAVDVLAQPVVERAELAGPDLVVEVGELPADPLPELSGDDVAEGVGREVADRPARPVHVLEHAVGDVGDVDPEVLVDLRVPRLTRVRGSETPADEILLELEAQDD